jgi:hypothetical protein
MNSTDYMRQATFTVDEWIDHWVKKNQKVKKTAMYKALKALEQEAKPAPAPPPPAVNLEPYRSGIYMAQNMLEALAAPAHYKVIVTADPAYDHYATRQAADTLRAAGHEIMVWYVPTEVSRQRADEVAMRLSATRTIGQAETAEQFDRSWEHGRRAVIGNLSAIRPDQLAKVAAGEMVFVNECYWGCGAGMPNWRNANAGVAGDCIAVYADGQCTRHSVVEHIAAGRFVRGRDSVYGPGMRAEDWSAL